jgi:hypothetical protein
MKCFAEVYGGWIEWSQFKFLQNGRKNFLFSNHVYTGGRGKWQAYLQPKTLIP